MDYKGIIIFGQIQDSLIKELEKDIFVDAIDYNAENFEKTIDRTLRNNKIPFLIKDNENYSEWNNQEETKKYMTFFIDFCQSDFEQQSPGIQEFHKNTKALSYANASYILIANDIKKTVTLIKKLWKFRNSGGVLSRELITLMIDCGMLIVGGNTKSISNASYDLLIGEEYYHGGKIAQLTTQDPFIQIEPYDYVIASCKEMTNFPRDISARFDISVNLFCQGIIMSNSTQVDPGFRGKLFCLLFNTSNKTVYLQKDTHFTTLEFHKLLEPTTPYSGKYNGIENILPYLPTNVLQGAIHELKIEIEKMKSENKTLQNIILGSLSIFLALIAILLVL